MPPLIHPSDRRFGTCGTLSRALLVAAVLLGCGLTASAVAAADDKAKAVVETPSKADAGQAATDTPPTSAAATGGSEEKTDSSTSKKSQRRRERIKMGDDDFDSFNEALHTAPWVVGLAFLVAGYAVSVELSLGQSSGNLVCSFSSLSFRCSQARMSFAGVFAGSLFST